MLKHNIQFSAMDKKAGRLSTFMVGEGKEERWEGSGEEQGM